jgi:serine/threonine protein kinase
MPSTLALAPGATVGGKYLLVRRIGVGGMGEVWVAKNRTTGAEVAVKMARGGAIGERSALRFRHEARLGAMLTHRGVVRIFDLVEEADGTLLLVMELLRGETLEHCMRRRGPLPTRDAIAIAVPVLAALAHAHSTGIVHRDVTPANVFLAIDPDGYVTPKLLDFGIAKLPAAGTKHTVDGRALGTPRYMAPERIREQDATDDRSDLFSVGVILYEMLTGICPFAAGTPAASLAAVLEVVVDPDPRIDPRVWIELRRSLSKRPYERQANALAMVSGLLAACDETEASLSDVLRQASPCRDLPGDDADPAQPTRTVDGHSLGGDDARSIPRRLRTVVSLTGAVVLVAALAAIGASFRRRPNEAVTPTLRADPVPARSSGAAPPLEAVSASALPSPSASASASASPATRVPVRPARPARPKPVATTPGF